MEFPRLILLGALGLCSLIFETSAQEVSASTKILDRGDLIVLFDRDAAGKATQVPHYDGLVKRLKNGSRVVMPDGKVFTIEKKLGQGNTTIVFQTTDPRGRALRLPAPSSWLKKIAFDIGLPAGYINSFYEGVAELKSLNIPTVDVFSQFPSSYVEVSLIKRFVRFEDFLNKKVDAKTHELMVESLKKVTRQMAPLISIGDFRADQWVFDLDHGTWRILDTTSMHWPLFMGDRLTTPVATPLYEFPSMRNPQGMNMFGPHTTINFDDYGPKRWTARSSRHQWIADLANQIDDEIHATRVALANDPVLRVNLTGKLDSMIPFDSEVHPSRVVVRAVDRLNSPAAPGAHPHSVVSLDSCPSLFRAMARRLGLAP